MKRNIYVYPQITDRQRLDDLVARLAWYLRPYLDAIGRVHLALPDAAWLNDLTLPEHFDPAIGPMLPQLRALIEPHHPQSLQPCIETGDPQRDVLLLIDVDAEEGAPPVIRDRIRAFQANGGFYRVDARKTRQEGSFYLWCGLNRFRDPAALIKQHKARLETMLADIGPQQTAYVFGTGPSLSDYVESHDFSDGLCIVANSIVKDKAALDRLKPRIICAADPIYHAGCSSYAGAFREALVEAMRQTGAWFVCPLRDGGIYESFLPPDLAARMVCLPYDAKKPLPVDLAESFYLHPFPNVLTLMLLPVAASFARHIRIAGCDGRRLLEDSFFWSHDRKVQFNDRMEAIQAVHPGFFAIDYNDYFLDHCLDVEQVLSALEASGTRVETVTPSLLPALHSREARPAGGVAPSIDTLVMLDPDAKDDWGHFLAYDKRVAEAAASLGMGFCLICRAELPRRFLPASAAHCASVFTVNSWTTGNKFPPQREAALRFAAELDAGLREIEAAVPEGDIALFFYVGSLEAAEMVEFLLLDHPRLHAVINLFWAYRFEQDDAAYRKRWQAVARRMALNPCLHLLHSTRQISDEYDADWALRLPVLQHPSTTFSDDEAQRLSTMPCLSAPLNGRPLQVVFPGGARAEKGFVLSLDAISQLRSDPRFEISLRVRLDTVSGPRLKAAYDAFDPGGVRILDGDLSDAQFIDMLREADIVVIPYHVEAFRRRTSGILVDAMLLGKPVVVLRDTWLADVVELDGLGVCAEPTAEGIAGAVRQIATKHDRFLANIEKARAAYLQTNSWAALVATVRGLADGTIKAPAVPDLPPPPPSPREIAARSALIRQAATLLLGDSPLPLDEAAQGFALATLPAHDEARAHFQRVQALWLRKQAQV